MKTLDIQHLWRSDIQGLRGLAVLFVIIGHLFPAQLPGGFIGVDVFFVISGFVITGQLQVLWATDRSKAIASFYARRMRRILPSALLVLFSTIIATKFLLGPIFQADASRDSFWATLFLANYHFAAQSQDYFAAGVPQSLVQHFWSLSIEEQFYLLWPVILLFLLQQKFSKRAAVSVVAILVVFSFMFSLANLYIFDHLNFFNSGARAWQLLTGCLISLVNIRLRWLSQFKILSIVMMVGAAISMEETMRWPNLKSVVVIASAAILCLPQINQRVRILELAPLVYIGDLSYLLYLWHWPILIIAKNYFYSFELRHILLVLLLTIVFTLISHYAIEKPLRRSQILVIRPGITIFSGIALICAASLTLRNLL